MNRRDKQRVTFADVAEKAGVSRSTGSRRFTEGASVSPMTRGKVMAAARTLGYSPNPLASSLTTWRTKLVEPVADNFSNPEFLAVFDGFTQLLQDRGFRPILVNLSEVTTPETAVGMLLRYSVDAVIDGLIDLACRICHDHRRGWHSGGSQLRPRHRRDTDPCRQRGQCVLWPAGRVDARGSRVSPDRFSGSAGGSNLDRRPAARVFANSGRAGQALHPTLCQSLQL